MADLAALVAEVKAALQQATPQPWTYVVHNPGGGHIFTPHGGVSISCDGIPKQGEWEANLAIFAKSPEWLGALVQAVEDLREKLGRANEQNQYCHDNHSPGQQMVIESQTQQLHDIRLEVAQLRADGQRLRELSSRFWRLHGPAQDYCACERISEDNGATWKFRQCLYCELRPILVPPEADG